MIQLFHPLLTLIAIAFDSLLAKYVLYLKKENRILRDRTPGAIHTKPHERAQLLNYGKPLGTSHPGPFIAGYGKRNEDERKSPSVGQERVPYCEN